MDPCSKRSKTGHHNPLKGQGEGLQNLLPGQKQYRSHAEGKGYSKWGQEEHEQEEEQEQCTSYIDSFYFEFRLNEISGHRVMKQQLLILSFGLDKTFVEKS